MSFALDASVSLAWCFADEADAATDALLQRLGGEQVWVPTTWALEIAHTLATAERRGRVDAAEMEESRRLMLSLPLRVDRDTQEKALGATLDLARELRLSAYDASYLELAQRRRLALATIDARMAAAARTVGVEVLP